MARVSRLQGLANIKALEQAASRIAQDTLSDTNPLTNAQLRATPVPVSGTITATGGLTNTELRATPVPVSVSGVATAANQVTAEATLTSILADLDAIFGAVDGLEGKDYATQTTLALAKTALDNILTKLNASIAVTGTFFQATQPVSGTFFQATQPVSAASLPLPTGAATSAKQDDAITLLTAIGTYLDSVETELGIVTETAPATDTASSGLNGRLQRIAQRLTTINTTLGTPFQAGGSIGNTTFASTVADGANVTLGAKTDAKSTATDATSVTAMQVLKQISASVQAPPSQAVTGPLTDTQLRATPVPVSGTVTASGPLTDTQLRASAVPVSLATAPVLVAGSALIGKVGLDQTTPGTTNATSLAQVGATTVATGNGVVGAGVQRVAIASDNTAFSVNATLAAETTKVIGTVNVAAAQSITATQATGTNLHTVVDSVTPPTLTKATQGSTGFSTQDLKDGGRAIVNAATAIAGVTAVTTEALLALNVSRDGGSTSSITTITVTSGKRFRVQAIVASVRSSAATVLSGRVSLRMNPSGSVTASSPIIAILSMTQQAAALAEAGDTCVLSVPDGIEFSGTMQFGLSQVCSGTGGVVYASIVGYEY